MKTVEEVGRKESWERVERKTGRNKVRGKGRTHSFDETEDVRDGHVEPSEEVQRADEGVGEVDAPETHEDDGERHQGDRVGSESAMKSRESV
jgi:hypothetical protein